MYFNRFDIVLAHLAFYMHHHGGQGCPMYARMGRIMGYFRPGAGNAIALDNPENDNAREIYNALCEKHGCPESVVATNWSGEA